MPPGYELSHCLSEGATGKVYFVVNQKTKDCLAAKIVSVTGDFSPVSSFHSRNSELRAKTIREELKRETEIHRKLRHPNISAVYGVRNTPSFSIMFMELITGGELFEQIPIDIGLHVQQMFMYYSQILDALNYLHTDQLIAHLDVKPENIMITRKDRAKLIDFGWAADLRLNPKLQGPVGTRIYAAPEVWSKEPYEGPSADLFSLGVTLVTAVTGQRCWSEADPLSDPIYRRWMSCKGVIHDCAPFNRLPADFINFLTRILAHKPQERLTYDQIKRHPWYQRGLQRRLTPVQPPTSLSVADKENWFAFNAVPQSQPTLSHQGGLGTMACTQPQLQQSTPLMSQPVDTASMLMGSQAGPQTLSEGASSAVVKVAHLLKRMTRFFSALQSELHTMEVIRAVLTQHPHLRLVKRGPCNLIVEIRQNKYPVTTFRLMLYRLAGSIMVDCRRISGDGLLFHRIFATFHDELKQMNAVNENHPYLSMVLPDCQS